MIALTSHPTPNRPRIPPSSEVDMPRNMKLWAGGLLGVLLVAACGGGQSVFSLEVGDCFDDPASQTAEVSDVDEASCSEDHDNEATRSPTTLRATARRFPAMKCLNSTALATASVNSRPTSESPTRSPVSTLALPSTGGWEQDGDHEVTCYLYDLEFAKLTGSMKGSGE